MGNILAVIVALATLLLAVDAAADGCPRDFSRPRTRIVMPEGQVAYDFTHDRGYLQYEMRGRATAAAGHIVIGLTRMKLNLGVQMTASTRRVGNRYCAYAETVTVTLGYGAFPVFVDSKYRVGSCEHATILAHENEHVAIARAALREFRPRAEQLLAQVLATTPVEGPSQQAAQQTMFELIMAKLEPLRYEIEAEAMKGHQKLDSPESYARSNARCSGW